MPSSRYKMPKEKRKPQENEVKVRAKTPAEKRRDFVIYGGVGLLVLAFLMTSGIAYVNLNQGGGQNSRKSSVSHSANESPQMEQVDSQIDYWTRQLAKNSQDANALANLGYYYEQKSQLEPLSTPSKPPHGAAATPTPGKGATASPAAGKRPGGTAAVNNKRTELLGKAQDYLKKAIAFDPGNSFAHRELAVTLMNQQHYKQARDQLNEALKAADRPPAKGEDAATAKADQLSQKVQAHMVLAALDARQNDIKAGLTELDTVIKLQPGSTQAYINRATLYERQHDTDSAQKDLSKALDIAQKMGDLRAQGVIRIHRAMLYEGQHDKAKARKDLVKALDIAQQTKDRRTFFVATLLLRQLQPHPNASATPAKPGPSASPSPSAGQVSMPSTRPSAKPSAGQVSMPSTRPSASPTPR